MPSRVVRVVPDQGRSVATKAVQGTIAPYRFVRKHQQPDRVAHGVCADDNGGSISEKRKQVRIKPALMT